MSVSPRADGSQGGASTSSTVHSILFAMPSIMILAVSVLPAPSVAGGSVIQRSWMVNQSPQVCGSEMTAQTASGEADSFSVVSMCPMMNPSVSGHRAEPVIGCGCG
ncbi:hypothetical protein GOHSU_41_00070 [Gordonia hirsuta DSM 44140 = NBRC 16056]|uniref:Uncharacterized protein n=1 Tax=Gordonia hirsuta DSM 44140 = NBRC 16056 TaxID=1121927 RepID=L7LBI6_9ACTN|nr:hypothetical protein GOHSU_41_00070 [Gordonia hirsuta DSM 44140 = NBRC 16056]